VRPGLCPGTRPRWRFGLRHPHRTRATLPAPVGKPVDEPCDARILLQRDCDHEFVPAILVTTRSEVERFNHYAKDHGIDPVSAAASAPPRVALPLDQCWGDGPCAAVPQRVEPSCGIEHRHGTTIGWVRCGLHRVHDYSCFGGPDAPSKRRVRGVLYRAMSSCERGACRKTARAAPAYRQCGSRAVKRGFAPGLPGISRTGCSLFREHPWVELAGIEPASFGTEPGLLRVQSVVTSSQSRRSH
jgi:hypothetical protein